MCGREGRSRNCFRFKKARGTSNNYSYTSLKNECSSLLQPSTVPKGKKAKGKKVALGPAVVKKQEAKAINPLFENRPRILASDRISIPKRTSCALSNGPVILAAVAKGYTV